MSSQRKGRLHTEKSKELMKKVKSIPILQYDLEGNFIKEWNSVAEAGIFLEITPQNISKNLKQHQKRAGNFIWKYKNKEQLHKTHKR